MQLYSFSILYDCACIVASQLPCTPTANEKALEAALACGVSGLNILRSKWVRNSPSPVVHNGFTADLFVSYQWSVFNVLILTSGTYAHELTAGT